MSALQDAATALAAFVATEVTTISPVNDRVPAQFEGGSAYVWPQSDWITSPEDGSYCVTRQVGLELCLVASTDELTTAQQWIMDRIDELWPACADGVEVLPGQVIFLLTAQRPVLMQPEGGGAVLVCAVGFSRFDLED